jgi:hypothetical protein
MERFSSSKLGESFPRFEGAAAKRHEEAIWITGLVKDVGMEKSIVKEAFAKTEEPLGWYFAAKFSDRRERFDFFKKSAEQGCNWAQVEYGWCFRYGEEFVQQDTKVFVEWLEKAANQNNPEAMDWLGDWYRDERRDKHKAVSYYRAAAELGWKRSMHSLARMLRDGKGCARDSRQAAIWSAKGDSNVFWDVLSRALERGTAAVSVYDFNQLCYSLGWGLYWYKYRSEGWNHHSDEDQAFGNCCLDFYCSCVELQQKSIFTFLWFWNQTTGGVKGPGQMIAQVVWEERKNNLLRGFEEERSQRRSE